MRLRPNSCAECFKLNHSGYRSSTFTAIRKLIFKKGTDWYFAESQVSTPYRNTTIKARAIANEQGISGREPVRSSTNPSPTPESHLRRSC